MVSVNQQTLNRTSANKWGPKQALMALGILLGIYIGGSVFLLGGSFGDDSSPSSSSSNTQKTSSTQAEDRQLRGERVNRPNRPQSVQIVLDESKWIAAAAAEEQQRSICSYNSLSDIPTSELYPKKGKRHMVDPPFGGKVSLVCCNTTVGPLNILAHHRWAPLGAARFMDMVTSAYFDSGVPLMRCVKGFLCQFGLNANNTKKGEFQKSIEDDPNWLPEGPPGRTNEQGVKRFAQGYLAYAGAGNKTRSKQLIMSLKANERLAGGSPWEVPWGELVNPESFETLNKIYTGYGEKGPPQGQLGPKGMTNEMREQWPMLDYINSCSILDEQLLPTSRRAPLTKEERR
jgi:peptidyl-prolyl cis-trans isomerase A (cyclophilin A)